MCVLAVSIDLTIFRAVSYKFFIQNFNFEQLSDAGGRAM